MGNGMIEELSACGRFLWIICPTLKSYFIECGSLTRIKWFALEKSTLHDLILQSAT